MDDYYLLGKISKAHGFKGQFSAIIFSSNPKFYSKMESVFITINEIPVPFFVKELSINSNKAIIKLEDIDTDVAVRKLIGNSLLIPSNKANPEDLDNISYEALINYKVIDKSIGFIGNVSAYFDNPGNELLAVTKDKNELFIPIRSNFITKVLNRKREIQVELPEGFIDLYYGDT
ncbi:MAG: ribosome maturation factor RimM [Bacteroidota bacterium]|nr:ribosome maturation factor RimM [Bacteroidota bacterium]